MDRIRLLVVDDHEMFATAIAAQLNQEDNIRVLESITDPRCLMARIMEHNPDVVLMDIRMRMYNGLELAEEIKKKNPAVKVILMSGYHISHFARDGGADAFASKEESITSLAQTIRKVCIDQANVFPSGGERILTNAEIKILNLISQDMTRREIAGELYISEKTVTNHITSILDKLQVRSRVGAIMKGVELGLINGK